MEIINSQELEDIDNENKEALTFIFNEIKTKNTNVMFQNIFKKRFGKSSKKVIEELFKMFDTINIRHC